mmetsp:Transcript_34778/g.78876  ORF Transcript_34778/g.78876 Transcript_34778/m.78876 type:complete len:81 (-) Transcript_34778:635-877(-)
MVPIMTVTPFFMVNHLLARLENSAPSRRRLDCKMTQYWLVPLLGPLPPPPPRKPSMIATTSPPTSLPQTTEGEVARFLRG